MGGLELDLKDVNVYYGLHALKGLSPNVEEGEIVTLIGSMARVRARPLRP